MMISQCPSLSTPLRMARKMSPSDQRLSCPAGVRLEATNDPIGTGRSSATSRPPVSVAVFEWQLLQKPSDIALPRTICSGLPATFKSEARSEEHTSELQSL